MLSSQEGLTFVYTQNFQMYFVYSLLCLKTSNHAAKGSGTGTQHMCCTGNLIMLLGCYCACIRYWCQYFILKDAIVHATATATNMYTFTYPLLHLTHILAHTLPLHLMHTLVHTILAPDIYSL